MNLERILEDLFPVLLILTVLSGFLIFFQPDLSSRFRIYEIFGALTASTITAFGILKMKELTELT